ncbi:MAG: hypothetical protein ABI797_03660 [Chloroflexota bacterium]
MPAPVAAATWSGRYSVWHKGGFATQYLDYSCVGATIQITLNLINNTSNRTKRRQLKYLDYAQEHSKYPVTDLGADAEGWAKALIHFGGGNDWGWATAGSLQAALKLAAKQIRSSGKPVGLLTFHGGHAWLMTGFESSADPAVTSNFSVTAAEVLGPLYPDGTYNGNSADPGPKTWMTVTTLGRRFNTYYQSGQTVWNGKWVMVVPKVSIVAPQTAGDNTSPEQVLPDLRTAFGWSWMLGALALRDLVPRRAN